MLPRIGSSTAPTTDTHAAGFKEEDRSDTHQHLSTNSGLLHVKIARQNGKPTATLRHCGVGGKVCHGEVCVAE